MTTNATKLNNAYAKLLEAQSEVNKVLEEIGADASYFETGTWDTNEVLETWIAQLDAGDAVEDLESEFLDRSF